MRPYVLCFRALATGAATLERRPAGPPPQCHELAGAGPAVRGAPAGGARTRVLLWLGRRLHQHHNHLPNQQSHVPTGMYDQYQRTLRRSAPRLHPVLADMSAAALAGASEALLTPFERLQILMQDRHYHERFANTWHAARQLRTFGLAEYYRGLVPILLRNSASNVLFFGLRERLKAAAPHDGGRASSAAWDFACGALIGAFISTVMYPLNVVKTHMQSRVGGPFAGVLATTAELYRARGRSVRALFRGVHINYTRSLISWGIINSTYELLRSHFV
ncbi:mitochondrial nicotinamide adenine dinucleotide transporter SLC25A51-like isoform X4 [Amphibalanus amphitrite]|uniref:mitochondrial nicotinamide adenine dinucleotide transporter SLC25A51-like isoform X4 n=1 Tax=Amphibalanus amphitrite TaxID=1232801 RepID=UPI001C91ED93|nr:mitochondrial nicotinamide adenine dinucleotide transporter SLC25A51-like isoform X4 [Amphibalanus amphitrite]